MVAVDESLVSRASGSRRLAAVTLGVVALGFGAAIVWLMPDNYRWCGWACAVLFVLGGCYLTFNGVRGRADDLKEFSAENLGGQLIAALVIGLLSLLW